MITNNEAWQNVIVLGQIAAVALTIIYFIWVVFYIKKNRLNKEQQLLFVILVLFFLLHIFYNFYFIA